MHGWGLMLWKKLKQGTAEVRLGSSVVEKAKIKYGWAFIPLEMLKYRTAGVFFH